MTPHIITIPIKCSTMKKLSFFVMLCNPLILIFVAAVLVEKWWEENKITFKCKDTASREA